MLALELSVAIVESKVVDEYERQLSNRRSLLSLCPESIEKRIGGNKNIVYFLPLGPMQILCWLGVAIVECKNVIWNSKLGCCCCCS